MRGQLCVARTETRVADLQALVPIETVRSEVRLPVELDERTLAGGRNQDEGVDAESLHHTVTPRNSVGTERPRRHV